MIAKKRLKKDEWAVSPVIGEILMVAIVVILAAVLGAFVFGMGDPVKMTYTVAATAGHPAEGKVTVTYMGGADADFVESINVSVNDNKLDADGDPNPWPTWSAGTTPTLAVGVSLEYTNGVSSSRTNHAIAIARFSDGTEQVILDTYV